MASDDGDDDLFSKRFSAYARGSDPSTSHEAAGSLKRAEVARMERIVLYAVSLTGDQGAICSQIEAMVRLPWKTLSPRLAPLHRKEMLEYRYDEHSKIISRDGPTNRRQHVHYATEAGIAWLKVSRYGMPQQ